MGAYTKDELKQIHEMRKEERAESDRRKEEWDTAKPGFTEEGTVYTIEFRHDDLPTWFGTTPFFDPIRIDPGETEDEAEAHAVAAEILMGKRGVDKQNDPGDYNITGVRVVKRYCSATIISQTETDVPRETSGSE